MRKAFWRLLRLIGIGLLVVLVLVISGVLLADRLTPRATGAPGHALALEDGQTEIDRELAPMLAANPGKTGVLMLSDGLDGFSSRAVSARRAGRSLDLQYYIWHDDLTGHLLAREVYRAAERGVRVRLLLDDMNAEGLDPKLMTLDAHPNIELRLYNPFRNRDGIGRLFEMVQRVFSVNHRMHNKAWIADGRVAVVGGRNIGEEYFSANPEVNFRDLDLLLFGPAVKQASTIFDDYWNSTAAVPVAALARKKPERMRELAAQLESEAA
ncbi:MAG TPA: phospholipase D-like domain-containing protein, partial [Dokdonella sp.]|nr:phospholipase D-like domain-containing protein [Dokdonella sp.]